MKNIKDLYLLLYFASDSFCIYFKNLEEFFVGGNESSPHTKENSPQYKGYFSQIKN